MYIVCYIILVQRFEPQGGRFTNLPYFVFIFNRDYNQDMDYYKSWFLYKIAESAWDFVRSYFYEKK